VEFWDFNVFYIYIIYLKRYEMLCGIPPFYNENIDRMYELIQMAELKFPKKIKVSEEAIDLISKFLIKNQNNRLGAKKGLEEFKSHPFFAKIDFNLISQKKITPPFVPEIKDKLDLRNFDEEFTGETVNQSVIPEKNLELIKKNQDKFKDFFN
jgi:serine/threonine protein kinase